MLRNVVWWILTDVSEEIQGYGGSKLFGNFRQYLPDYTQQQPEDIIHARKCF
jgi:hypothetical protein